MSRRPQPRPARKSRLTGLSPTNPGQPPEPAPDTVPEADPARPKQAPETTPARPAKTGGKTKVGIYLDADDAARLRGAAKFIPNELRADGINGFSALAAKLVMDGLAELERTYNDGEPWPSLAPGEELPRGRKVQ